MIAHRFGATRDLGKMSFFERSNGKHLQVQRQFSDVNNQEWIWYCGYRHCIDSSEPERQNVEL